MTKTHVRQRILEWVLAGLLVNQGAVPITGSVAIYSYFHSSTPSLLVPEYTKQARLRPGAGAREYLDMANGAVHRYSQGRGDCKEFTHATFSAYKSMTVNDGRSDLLDDVRIAAELVSDDPHVWLQVYEGEWRDYESLYYTPLLSSQELRRYGMETRVKKATFEEPTHAQWVSIPGTAVALPSMETFVVRGGFFSFKNRIDDTKRRLQQP